MPGTVHELCCVVVIMASQVFMPDTIDDIVWEDGDKITDEEKREVNALSLYEGILRRGRKHKAQRRAMRLLKTFLTPEQIRRVRDKSGFFVRGSLGGLYRLYPLTGAAVAVELHGKRWYGRRQFCLHEDDWQNERTFELHCLPPADRSLAHMFLLITDEQKFLDDANHYDRNDLWNGEYLRDRRQRRERDRHNLEMVVDALNRRAQETITDEQRVRLDECHLEAEAWRARES